MASNAEGTPGSRTAKAPTAVGFVTVVQHDQHGLFGGLLVLNTAGRPLEFHCTAPLKPNRAQEILFGPTLQPYLFGEQIAKTLIVQVQDKLCAALTDLEPVLAARDLVEIPLVQVQPPVDEPSKVTQLRFDAPHGGPNRPGLFRLGRYSLVTAVGRPDDEALVVTRLQTAVERLDLYEPFGRIREAIDEAQRSGR
ncbi:MAG: hypothetical protein JNM18_18860 [Planctomycetaceae bacterium]|nr:hypothetical protein [Planctomycetaceae bacterium]